MKQPQATSMQRLCEGKEMGVGEKEREKGRRRERERERSDQSPAILAPAVRVIPAEVSYIVAPPLCPV